MVGMKEMFVQIFLNIKTMNLVYLIKKGRVSKERKRPRKLNVGPNQVNNQLISLD
jgi:hypothetical protein